MNKSLPLFAGTSGPRDPLVILAGFLALAVLASLPILSAWLPPILDYPNHLARMHVLASLPSTPELQGFYALAWGLIPNLAMDAVVPRLASLMPVEIAGKLFLLVMLIGTAGGCLVLHRTLYGRWSVWPLFAFLLLYNRMLLWGFINYLSGVALMLWGLAAWVAMAGRPPFQRIAVGVVFALAIYFAHLAAFGAYAVALIGFSLAPPAGERFALQPAIRRVLPAAITLMLPAVLFLFSPTSGAPAAISYGNFLRKFDMPVSIFHNYYLPFDGATFGILLIAVIVGLVKRKLAVERRFQWGLIGLILVYLATPSQFLTASGIDKRLPVAIALLFVAVTDWSAISLKRRTWITAGLAALLLVRMAVIETVWVKAGITYRALAGAFQAMPEGSKLALAVPINAVQVSPLPLLHFGTLAVLERNAFVPTLFADPAQQPLRLTPEGQKLAAPAKSFEQSFDLWQAVAKGILPPLPGYNYLLVADPPEPLRLKGVPGEIVFQQPRLVLIRLNP